MAAPYEFKLPDLGEGLMEGEVARWLVKEGQQVFEDDPIVEVQTDKTMVEIPSQVAGKVLKILVAEGSVVPVGTVLLIIGDDKAPLTAEPIVPTKKGGLAARIRAMPLIRKLAKDIGVDLSQVTGSGPGGRITEQDVRTVAREAHGHASEGKRVPLRGIRRLISEHMTRAHREIPPVTWVEECDFHAVNIKVLVPTVVKVCAITLKEFPELNARLERDAIVFLEHYDIGVVVQTEPGIVVPVVRAADTKSIETISAELVHLAKAAREGTLLVNEVRDSTFTVTSAGKLAGLFNTPIVNHPEVAILSIGRIGPRPVVRNGEIVIRTMGNISITFDHRVIDGGRAAQFGLAVIKRLENLGQLA